MPDAGDAKNQSMETDEQNQGQAEENSPSTKDKMKQQMDQARKKLDTDQDGKVDADEAKKAGQDAVNKVKGLFKKS